MRAVRHRELDGQHRDQHTKDVILTYSVWDWLCAEMAAYISTLGIGAAIHSAYHERNGITAAASRHQFVCAGQKQISSYVI